MSTTTPAKPKTITCLTTCSCGRPKSFGYKTRCELCKFYSLETPPSPDLYRWIENKNPHNPQVKQIGFSTVAEVCKSCIHFKKIDHEGRNRYERWKTTCANHIAETALKPYWPACHNFILKQPKVATKAPVSRDLKG